MRSKRSSHLASAVLVLACFAWRGGDRGPTDGAEVGAGGASVSTPAAAAVARRAEGPALPGAAPGEPPPPVEVERLGSLEVATGEALVRFDAGRPAEEIRRDLRAVGAEWAAVGAPDGLWRVAFGPDRTAREALEAVASVPGARGARLHPVVRGAARGKPADDGGGGGGGKKGGGGDGCGAGDLVSLQWDRTLVGAAADCRSTLPSTVIAVLDTGVAYESGTQAGLAFKQVPELAGVPILHPWDFVDGDDQAYDEHQHGTHVAGLIASRDRLRGHAHNPVLMPIRVLDEHMVGTEWGLLQGLQWAIDHGAQVANLSLTFSLGYLPSRELIQVVDDAWNAGLVIVAASGNDGQKVAAYPASLPRVIAVGGVAQSVITDRARFANASYTLEVAGPAGDLEADTDGSLLDDGLLAQTIQPGNPAEYGYWVMAGTSQATPVVASQVAHLLSRGVSPDDVRLRLLEAAANPGPLPGSLLDVRWGMGLAKESLLGAVSTAPSTRTRWYANPVSGIERAPDGRVRATLAVEVVDEAGQPAGANLEVFGQFRGTTSGAGGAITDAAGVARLTSPWSVGPVPVGKPLFWSFDISGVVDHAEGGEPTVPGGFYRLSDGTAALLDSLLNGPEAGGGAGFRIDPADPLVCDLFDCATLLTTYESRTRGGGFSSSTFGLMFNDGFLSSIGGAGFSSSTFTIQLDQNYFFSWGSADSGEVTQFDLSGSGFSSSTFNVLSWDRAMFGSGFSSSTFNVLSAQLTGYSGSSLYASGAEWESLGSGFSSSTFNLLDWYGVVLASGLGIAEAYDPEGATVGFGAVPAGPL